MIAHSRIIWYSLEPVRRSFVSTRHRSADIDTSRLAAQSAASQTASERRLRIRKALAEGGCMTYKEIAKYTGIDGIEVARRLSEIGGIERMEESRDNCRLWRVSV